MHDIKKYQNTSALLRLPQVLELIPIGKSTLWAKIKRGEFPKQIKLSSKISVWKASDIQAYIEKHSLVHDEVHNV